MEKQLKVQPESGLWLLTKVVLLLIVAPAAIIYTVQAMFGF